MIAPAQKKPSLNWVEVFHPSFKLMIPTKMPQMSEKRIALIRMRKIGLFLTFSNCILSPDWNKRKRY